MKEHDANEQRYRNGYAAGYEAGKRDAVKHGRWKRRGRNLGECSECGEIVMVRYPYCPNCGAKMDGGVKNE